MAYATIAEALAGRGEMEAARANALDAAREWSAVASEPEFKDPTREVVARVALTFARQPTLSPREALALVESLIESRANGLASTEELARVRAELESMIDPPE
ncbi:MAG: hypothetical protein R3B68_12885 [Phycisphaerales bacterium]